MIYLSIVVPVRNEERFIENTLRQLVEQDFPENRYEILVVDGRSTDGTRNIVNKFITAHPTLNIKLLDNPGRLSSRGRNVGARKAKGEIIAFIDGHVHIPDDQLFANIEKYVSENNALSLARPQHLNVPGLSEASKAYWIAVSRNTWLGHSTKSFIFGQFEGFVDPTSSGFAYVRSVFETVGYFDENFDAAEDVEFNYRVKESGILAYISPKLLVYYYPRASFRALFKQQTRYGIGRAKFIKKHPHAFTVETLVPVAVFIFFMILPLSIITPIPTWCSFGFMALAIVYSAILLLTAFREVLQRRRVWPVFWVWYGIWITHMGLGWGIVKQFIRGMFVNDRVKTIR